MREGGGRIGGGCRVRGGRQKGMGGGEGWDGIVVWSTE